MTADELEEYAENMRAEDRGEDESSLITFELDEALYKIETHDLNKAFRLFDTCLIEGSQGLYSPKKPENPIAIAHDERKVILIGFISGIDLRAARTVVEAVKLFRYGQEFYLQYLARTAENAAHVMECLTETPEVSDQILDVTSPVRRSPCTTTRISFWRSCARLARTCRLSICLRSYSPPRPKGRETSTTGRRSAVMCSRKSFR